jgi:hypothetical protein
MVNAALALRSPASPWQFQISDAFAGNAGVSGRFASGCPWRLS